MIGTKDDPGLVQLVSNSIFDRIETDSESKNFWFDAPMLKYTMKMSMIY